MNYVLGHQERVQAQITQVESAIAQTEVRLYGLGTITLFLHHVSHIYHYHTIIESANLKARGQEFYLMFISNISM